MGRAQRRETATKWLCKSCVHPVSGAKWWNGAAMQQCGKCGRAKGVCYGGPLPPASPSVSTRKGGGGAEKEPPWQAERTQKLLQSLQAEVKQLRAAQRGGGSAPPPATAPAAEPGAMQVDDDEPSPHIGRAHA